MRELDDLPAKERTVGALRQLAHGGPGQRKVRGGKLDYHGPVSVKQQR